MRALILAMACVAVAVAAGEARASVTVTFEELSGAITRVPDGYSGFSSNNLWFTDASLGQYASSGFVNGAVSGTRVAYNGSGRPASLSGSPFAFNSAYFTSAWNDDLTIKVDAFRGGSLLHSDSFMVDTKAPTFRVFNWAEIDELRFSASGGSPAGGLAGRGTHFTIDDLVVNDAGAIANPEPLSLAIWSGLITAAVAVAAARRRLRAQPVAL
ncbi:MAG: hypothetical protein ACOY3P_15520 [Planctomycetota bacterium]